MAEFTKFPYRSEFPDSSERARNHQSLGDALWWARFTIDGRWSETNEHGTAGEYHNDSRVAVITNRNTGYRWILRRGDHRVEFQTPDLFEASVADQYITAHLTVEEAEALARAAKSEVIKDKRRRALVEQALDQFAILCRRVRDRVRAGDTFIDGWTREISRREADEPEAAPDASEPIERQPRPRFRPLGDPDNLSLKEAGEILGKARNTVYLWFKQGKFPPAVDVGPHIPYNAKPMIVVPRYRLEAWQAGERMPAILQEVFETKGLHEPPWVCFTPRPGASRKDVEFWVERRSLQAGITKDGKRIYGEDLTEGKKYELVAID